MTQGHEYEAKVLEVLKRAVAEALERKRKLGQYRGGMARGACGVHRARCASRAWQERVTACPENMLSTVGQPERATQNRIVALFRDELGYRYLGDWTDRDGNSNIEEGLLSTWLTGSGHSAAQISVALHKLRTEATNHNRTLYGNNQAVYSLLRYGVPVKIEAGKVTETVHLIDWNNPEKNDFAIAEEVTLAGQSRAAARRGAVCQRHRHRRAGTEEQPRHHRRRHPAVPVEPDADVPRVVLQHRAVHLRRQRLRGIADTARSARRRNTF